MNDNTAKLLQELSDKLGTTTELLWSILLKQARVDAWICIIQTLLIWAAIFGFYCLHKYMIQGNDERKSVYYKYDELAILPMVIAGVLLFILFCVSICLLETSITAFLNPEYWALDKILDTLKSHR